MTNKQILKKQMYGRVQSYFQKHTSTFSTYIPLSNEISFISESLVVLDKAEGAQATIITDVATRKQRVLREWVKALVPLNATARAYARRHNTDLLAAINVDEYYYINVAGEESAERGKAAITVLRNHFPDMKAKGYDITLEHIDAVNQQILDYEAILPTPAIGIDYKQKGTADIEATMDTIDESLKIVDDLIRSKYASSNPDLVAEYRIARRVGDTATNHTTLRAKVLENSMPLWNADVVIRELGRRDDTDLDGIAEIEEFKPGEYNIDVFKGNTLLSTQTVRIPLGKTVTLTFDLKTQS